MINEVRNAVLAILNKNNYGYISPSDFNLYAANAQMELYEENFSSYNKVVNAENARQSGTGYADVEQPIAETLETFLRIDKLTHIADNKYYMPSLLTTGYNAYMINKMVCYDGDTNARLGEAEKVSNTVISMLVNSNLTAPTKDLPSYSLVKNIIYVYPESINGTDSLECSYFTYPKVPKWTYITLSNGSPAFDQSQSDYQDFELPDEDGYKLVTKILEYCGMSIRETEVAQFGMAQQQHEQPTFSMQQ
jgi:hypothetical protein